MINLQPENEFFEYKYIATNLMCGVLWTLFRAISPFAYFVIASKKNIIKSIEHDRVIAEREFLVFISREFHQLQEKLINELMSKNDEEHKLGQYITFDYFCTRIKEETQSISEQITPKILEEFIIDYAGSREFLFDEKEQDQNYFKNKVKDLANNAYNNKLTAEQIKNIIDRWFSKKTRHKRKLQPQTITFPTGDGYAHSLCPFPRDYIISKGDKAYIKALSPEALKQIKTESSEVEIKSTTNFSQNIAGRDFSLLSAVYSFIYQDLHSSVIETRSRNLQIAFYEQDLANYIHMDVRGKRRGNLVAKLLQLDDLVGFFEDESFYKLFTINSFDKSSGKIVAYAGYFEILKKILTATKTTWKKEKATIFHTSLLLTSAHYIKAHYSIEIASYIIGRIQRAGTRISNGKKVKEIKINPQTVINNIPQLKLAFDTARTVIEKNQILSRAFNGAFEILKTHSLLKHDSLTPYYINFSSITKIPTVTTIKIPFVFKHEGHNKEFSLPPKR